MCKESLARPFLQKLEIAYISRILFFSSLPVSVPTGKRWLIQGLWRECLQSYGWGLNGIPNEICSSHTTQQCTLGLSSQRNKDSWSRRNPCMNVPRHSTPGGQKKAENWPESRQQKANGDPCTSLTYTFFQYFPEQDLSWNFHYICFSVVYVCFCLAGSIISIILFVVNMCL